MKDRRMCSRFYCDRMRERAVPDGGRGAAISNGIGQCLDIINGKECPTIIPAEEDE